MKYLILLLLCLVLLVGSTFAQNPPADFNLQATTAGTRPWSDMEIANINAGGQVEFIMTKGSPPQTITDTSYNINTYKVWQLWQTLQDYYFFSLDSNLIDTAIKGGSLAIITLTANGKTKQIVMRDSIEYDIQGIIDSINTVLPANYKLSYTPPEEIYFTPQNPARMAKRYFSKPFKKNKLMKTQNKLKSNNELVSSITDSSQVAHGGVEIGYEIPLSDAITTGAATLKSKGEYFGDAVSITGENTKNFPPAGDTLIFKFNLEFYDTGDTKANETKIENDIYNKWNRLTTSTGEKIKIEFSTLSNPGKVFVVWAAGYDYIRLKNGHGRSYVGAPNYPIDSSETVGTWYTNDPAAGIYGYEAGHLMGLDDPFEEWYQTSSGVWQNIKTGNTLSSSAFTNLFNLTYGTTYSASYLNKYSVLCIISTGHSNDLMADISKHPLQSDIDKLADKAGLIIHVKAGDVISNKDTTEQNLVIIHSQDLFVKPGYIKTLNGIFTACIDAYNGSPTYDAYMDLAPSLDEWQGIPSAEYMLKVAHFADTLIYYGTEGYDIQDAVWRISDNVISPFADSTLKHLGINLGNSILHFPKLQNDLTNDSISTIYIPDELLIPNIQPKYVQAAAGEKLSFNTSILEPAGYNNQISYTWLLSAPNGSSSVISSGGSFIPDRSGIYTISLKMNISGSDVVDTTGYIPDAKSYVVVPDNYTETFEHQGLSNRFPWQTSGDNQWHITNKSAQTGTYCATTSNTLFGQSSTLSINVNLPKDTTITFAVKLISNEVATLEFDTDSDYVNEWNQSIDWHVYTYQLSAGEHYLSWVLSDGPSTAWIDNVFFPPNSVVEGISNKQDIPLAFRLYQNYPNPFNPTTTIEYQIPNQSHVVLKVYDILGNQVAVLVNKDESAGRYTVNFNASKLSSGVYFYRIEAGKFVQSKKLILLK